MRDIPEPSICDFDYLGESRRMYVYRHTLTSVLYLVYKGPGLDAAGLTVMLDADGKPLVWEGKA